MRLTAEKAFAMKGGFDFADSVATFRAATCGRTAEKSSETPLSIQRPPLSGSFNNRSG
jgi:hypothetical protein